MEFKLTESMMCANYGNLKQESEILRKEVSTSFI